VKQRQQSRIERVAVGATLSVKISAGVTDSLFCNLVHILIECRAR
jgi:hypothetical protein